MTGLETLLINSKDKTSKRSSKMKHRRRTTRPRRRYIGSKMNIAKAIGYGAAAVLVGGLATKAFAQTSTGQNYPWVAPAALTVGTAMFGKRFLKGAYAPAVIALGATAVVSGVMSTPQLSGLFSDMCGKCNQKQLNDYMLNRLNGYTTGNLSLVNG